MLQLARICPPNDDGSLAPSPDGRKVGGLWVIYKGEKRWAIPCFAFGRFIPPSGLWVGKYHRNIGVWVTTEAAFFAEENDRFLVYLGFHPLQDGMDSGVMQAYPDQSWLFDERWVSVHDNTKDAPSITYKYTGSAADANPPDATGVPYAKVDMSPGAENAFYDHIVAGEPIGTKVSVDNEGSVTTLIHKDDTKKVDGILTEQVVGAVDLTFNDDVTVTADGASKKVGITISGELLEKITKKVTQTLLDELSIEVSKLVTQKFNSGVETTVTGDVTESITGKMQTDITSSLKLNAQTFNIRGTGGPSAIKTLAGDLDITVAGGNFGVSAPNLSVSASSLDQGPGPHFSVALATHVMACLNEIKAIFAAHTHTCAAPTSQSLVPSNAAALTLAALGSIPSTGITASS